MQVQNQNSYFKEFPTVASNPNRYGSFWKCSFMLFKNKAHVSFSHTHTHHEITRLLRARFSIKHSYFFHTGYKSGRFYLTLLLKEINLSIYFQVDFKHFAKLNSIRNEGYIFIQPPGARSLDCQQNKSWLRRVWYQKGAITIIRHKIWRGVSQLL